MCVQITTTMAFLRLLCLFSRFLRCSPFDEYKLWKAQVDNGSKRGRERLNILTQNLLLRRTKDQMDSTGKPLVGTQPPLELFQWLELSIRRVGMQVFDWRLTRESECFRCPFRIEPAWYIVSNCPRMKRLCTTWSLTSHGNATKACFWLTFNCGNLLFSLSRSDAYSLCTFFSEIINACCHALEVKYEEVCFLLHLLV